MYDVNLSDFVISFFDTLHVFTVFYINLYTDLGKPDESLLFLAETYVFHSAGLRASGVYFHPRVECE